MEILKSAKTHYLFIGLVVLTALVILMVWSIQVINLANCLEKAGDVLAEKMRCSQ